MDLFNHGFYWEAHEAWEPLWRAANAGSSHRDCLKGLILLAAAGVKLREGKHAAAARHGRRAAALFARAAGEREQSLELQLGMSRPTIAALIDAATATGAVSAACPSSRQIVFSLVLQPTEIATPDRP